MKSDIINIEEFKNQRPLIGKKKNFVFLFYVFYFYFANLIYE